MNNLFSGIIESFAGVQGDMITVITAMIGVGVIILGVRVILRTMMGWKYQSDVDDSESEDGNGI